jgi:hypothetical protein
VASRISSLLGDDMTDNTTKIYQALSSAVGALLNCLASNNAEWKSKWEDRIKDIMRSAPSGSGIDCGTELDLDASTADKLVFTFEYHHMNENGYYDGWTSHKAIVTGSLQFGKSLHITGRDRNNIKEYLHETFDCWIEDFTDRYPTF